jgi:hypothetical protein
MNDFAMEHNDFDQLTTSNEQPRYKYIKNPRQKPAKRPILSTLKDPSLPFVIYSPLLLVQYWLLYCWLRSAGSTDLDLSVRRRRLVGVDAGRGWLRGACDATRRRFSRSRSSTTTTNRCRDRFLGRDCCPSHDRLLRGWCTRGPGVVPGRGSRKGSSIVLGGRSRKGFLSRPGSA